MVLLVHRPIAGDLTYLLAYDPARRHTSLIPAAGPLGQSLMAALSGHIVGYFNAEIGDLHGEGEDATFVPNPTGSLLKILIHPDER